MNQVPQSSPPYTLPTHSPFPQDRRLTDATAYLLERTGDVVGALKLLLVAISQRTAALRSVTRRFNGPQFAALIASIQVCAVATRSSLRHHDVIDGPFWRLRPVRRCPLL